MRAVFFGTPEIAVPALRALAGFAEVVGVVCQPDRPAGRGLKLRPPAVKVAALELGLEVHQPVKVKTGNLDEWLAERKPDLGLVMAYGRILPPPVLAVPRLGMLNLHASLLPKYRGAAPINWALINGESESGICLMQMEEGLDTGPVFARSVLALDPEETAGELSQRMADLAAKVTLEQLPLVFEKQLQAEPQDERLATHAPPIRREHTLVDWSQPAPVIANLVRGLSPRPGASTRLEDKGLKLLRARALHLAAPGDPGMLFVDSGRVLVSTGGGALEVLEAQLEGRRALSARDLVNGRALRDGQRLG